MPADLALAHPPGPADEVAAGAARGARAGRLRLLVDAADSSGCVAELAGCHDPVGGVVVCHPGPGGRGTEALAVDVLVALGKAPGEAGVRGRAWELARVWLWAERIRHLVVLRAHLLSAEHWRALAALTEDPLATTDRGGDHREGLQVWLVVHRFGMDPVHQAVLDDVARDDERAGRPVLWRAGLARLRTPGIESGRGGDAAAFPRVPDVGFLTFRAVAARLLDSAGFARVDAVYREVLISADTAARAVRAGRDEPAAAVQRLTIDASCPDELRTRRRALEAGFFRAGLWLHLGGRPDRDGHVVHHVGYRRARNDDRPRLDEHTVTRLRLLALPVAAAALTLTRCGLHLDHLGRLRVRDIAAVADGGLQITTTAGRYRVPPAASPLVAGHTHAVPDADTSDGMLFALTPAALTRLLSDAATRTGLPAPRGRHRDIQITDLTTPAPR